MILTKNCTIKFIDESDFIPLLKLYIKYQNLVNPGNPNTTLANGLLSELSYEGSQAIGLYKYNELRGFIIGKMKSDEIFHFTSIYVEPRYRIYVRKLLDYSEDYIKGLGYSAWVSESHTKEGINLLSKYGAKIEEIKYYKEL